MLKLKGFCKFCRKAATVSNSVAHFKETCSHLHLRFKASSSYNSGIGIIRRNGSFIIGFSIGVVGVFGGKNCGGLNFKMSPYYSPKESYENNLKAMVVAMMMTDNLDKDEVAILSTAVESVYVDKENSSDLCKKRENWCFGEMKNFMNCSERYGTFQDSRCTAYRKLLKACLEAKKADVVITATNYDNCDIRCPPSTRLPCQGLKSSSVDSTASEKPASPGLSSQNEEGELLTTPKQENSDCNCGCEVAVGGGSGPVVTEKEPGDSKGKHCADKCSGEEEAISLYYEDWCNQQKSRC